jgi:hypothetical protein
MNTTEQIKAQPETPRTNAIEYNGLVAIIDLARQLERELDEMNRIAVSRYRQICRITAMWREDIEKCDRLKEEHGDLLKRATFGTDTPPGKYWSMISVLRSYQFDNQKLRKEKDELHEALQNQMAMFRHTKDCHCSKCEILRRTELPEHLLPNEAESTYFEY